MAVSKVVLDLETFKALASESRLSVLRALGERRKTLSELARDLELNKATVHEHLQVLVASGLVKKLDEGRKWIYYELTWRGQTLLNPEASTAFSVLLALSVAAAGGGVAMLGRALGFWWQENQLRGAGEEAGTFPAEDAMGATDERAAAEGQGDDTADASGDSGGGGDPNDPEAGDSSPPPESGDTSTASDGMGDTAASPVAPSDDAAEAADSIGGPMWLDDGGWIALALLAAAALFLLMAFLIRRRPPHRGKANTQSET